MLLQVREAHQQLFGEDLWPQLSMPLPQPPECLHGQLSLHVPGATRFEALPEDPVPAELQPVFAALHGNASHFSVKCLLG